MVNLASALAYSHLNLKINPFGELNREQRARVAVVDIEGLRDALMEPGTAIQFEGNHGHGKSTHLLALHALLPQYPYTQIHTDDKPRFTREDVQFVDSIEHLSRWKRRRLYRRSGSISFTSHSDLSVELEEAGYNVISRHIAQRCPARLTELLNRRIRFARRDKNVPVPLIREATATQLISRFGTDIRAMENHLYEVFQDLKEIQDV